MSTITSGEIFTIRQRIVEAIQEEMHTLGSGPLAEAAKRFLQNPGGASLEDWITVGAIPLKHFYVGEGMPDKFQRQNLWSGIARKMGATDLPNPPNWDRETLVMELQILVEKVWLAAREKAAEEKKP